MVSSQEMNVNLIKKEPKEASISKTGYRALLLFRLLLESPKTRDEIIEIFTKDPFIGKDLSKDTITNTANALRDCGCLIARPNMRTDFRYVLSDHPFAIKISKRHGQYLQNLRKSIISYGEWEKIEQLNRLYIKIAEFAQDTETRDMLLYNRPLKDIDDEILRDVVRYAKSKKTVNFSYNSPKNGIEDLKFIPDFIQFENDKLYVWGYSFKYDNIGYLRIDKIKSVNIISFEKNDKIFEEYRNKITKATYSLHDYCAQIFVESEHEKIIKKTKSKILVEATVYSEFNFLQKILSYGPDCALHEPQDLRTKFIDMVKNLRAAYDKEE